MSKNRKVITKGCGGVLDLVRERKQKRQATESFIVEELVGVGSSDPLSEAHGMKKPVDDGAWAADSFNITITTDACAHTNSLPHREQINKMLWSEDRCVLESMKSDAYPSSIDHIFMRLQGAIYMLEKIWALEANLSNLDAKCVGLVAENGVLTAAKEDLERTVRELQAQLEEAKRAMGLVNDLTAQVSSLEETVARLTEQLDTIAVDAKIETRIEMVRDYEAGKGGTWDLASLYTDYDEMMAMRAEDKAQVDGMETQGPAGH